jgi:hypothetical protein
LRSRGHCEIEHLGCPGFAAHFHHRQMRSQGGAHTPENLLHVCVPMHHRIHADPGAAFRAGWLVRRSEDPATVPWVSRDNQPGR